MICVLAHREGELLVNALEAASQAQSENNEKIDVIIALDSADYETVAVAKKYSFPSRTFNFNDVGCVRNSLLEEFANTHSQIAFIDGDDWCSSGWLTSTFSSSLGIQKPRITCPRTRVILRDASALALKVRQPNTFPPYRRWRPLVRVTNLWGSCMVINQAAARKIRFRTEREGYLSEDWWFFFDALSENVQITTTEGEYFYLQKTTNSRRRIQGDKNGLRPGFRIPIRKLFSLTLFVLNFRGLRLTQRCRPRLR